ncbi:aspartyl-tRNA(Asn)/glutamyl-tRNA(Gln) amidotransferase subunit C protein [Dioscorea alata]|uniref:Aspartyl-tRNA(Asn)/glutamyl-tRNA(Gln) amidotransferase subunit C protein n=1 Tax=Dioscorea alata TaxID=55571 RepID=A0ACB7UMD2_DIOAL|nr:aspartyl-tRNA(Asn)/glutamyl-tRNA(Gln) amidotransferase subunit C protein [Dioscorea alata]
MSSLVVGGGGAAVLWRLRLGSGGWRSRVVARRCSSSLSSADLARLADAARISLAPHEAQEFAPKIRQMVDWFGQLQAVNLESVEPSLRADTVITTSRREDAAEVFDNREAILAALPSYNQPYIKVPKVLNKE